MARWALAGVVVMLAAVGSSAAATMPAFTLHDGQMRYLLPAQVKTGEVIRCIAGDTFTDATMPGTSGSGFFGRSPDPYVIGQNGLALTRGRNSLAALERIYGRPTLATTPCRVTWQAIGLVAKFAGAHCAGDSVLAGATVEGSRWGSLRGVRIGDTVAKMLWEAQDAKTVVRGRWLLASGGSSHHAKLVAVARSGKVARFVLSGV